MKKLKIIRVYKIIESVAIIEMQSDNPISLKYLYNFFMCIWRLYTYI